MDYKSHFIVAVGCFVALWLLFPSKVGFTSILLPILCNSLADTDLKFDSHRNIFYHSIVIPMTIYLFNPSLILCLVVVSFGLHCACDLSLRKKGGYYVIKLIGDKAIKGFKFANFWLTLNFIVSIIIMYYQLFLVV